MYHPLSLAAVSFHFTQNLNIEYRRLLACEERERESILLCIIYTEVSRPLRVHGLL